MTLTRQHPAMADSGCHSSPPPFLTFSLTVPLSCPIPQEPPKSYVTILLPPPTSENGSEWMFKNSGPQSNAKISSLNSLRTISLSALPTCYPQCHIPYFVTVVVVLVSLNIRKKHRITPSYREWCCYDKSLNSYS